MYFHVIVYRLKGNTSYNVLMKDSNKATEYSHKIVFRLIRIYFRGRLWQARCSELHRGWVSSTNNKLQSRYHLNKATRRAVRLHNSSLFLRENVRFLVGDRAISTTTTSGVSFQQKLDWREFGRAGESRILFPPTYTHHIFSIVRSRITPCQMEKLFIAADIICWD